jgi:hypothetical protein
MTDRLGDRLYNKDSLKARLKQSKRGVNKAGKIPRVNSLDELSSRLGLIESGEFRVGNQKEPGKNFTGVRLVYPGVDYGGDLYNLVGVNSDVIQWGGRVSDGVFVAGGGVVSLDADGITLDATDLSPTVQSTRINWVRDVAGTSTEFMRLQGVDYLGTVSGNLYLDGDSIQITCEDGALRTEIFMTSGSQVELNFGTGDAIAQFRKTNGIWLNPFGDSDYDFRYWGDTDTHLIFADASVDNVGIGESTPLGKLHVNGEVTITRQAVTISGGSIAATSSYIQVAPEGGVADDLVTVTGLVTGSIYIFENAGNNNITVKDGTGSFNLAGSADFVLSTVRDKLICIARNTTNLDEISRSTN